MDTTNYKYKTCNICNVSLSINDFYKLGYTCKHCLRKINKEKYAKNREYIKQKVNNYKLNNRDAVLKSKKLYREKNKDNIIKKQTAYAKRKLKLDPIFKTKHYLRSRLRSAVRSKAWKRNTHFAQYIGCDLETLKSHLESQFDTNMSWDNQGSYWHIDHKIPLSSAKTVEELYKLCHYTNLQPLDGLKNIKKGAKLDYNK